VESNRDKQSKTASFNFGDLKNDSPVEVSSRRRGTKVEFIPDSTIFKNYKYRLEYVERMIKNYVYLNPGLTIELNGEKFFSENGLKDLLTDYTNESDLLYPIIHIRGEDIEVALTHSKTQYSEEYHSFVNGQHTTQGGTHQSAFREGLVKTIRDHFGKNYDSSDIRKSIISAVSIKVMEPVFESQTKTKLGSTEMGEGMPSVRSYIVEFLSTQLDNYLHKNPVIAQSIQKKIIQAEKERKELSGIRKLARERAKKASLHNKKLRDCRVHLPDLKKNRRLESTLFITEGDSASGSITKSRDVNTQAVFSLRGKPLNSYGMSKKIVYENEEFNLLQSALNIEDSLENLRYNNIVIATDADVDGMHIRLLLITFFLQFFPELIKEGHLYILQTPLFRVRDKKQTFYCYSEQERRDAIEKLSGKPEITRFKGLGEISPDEFKFFIGENIRLDPVMLDKNTTIDQLLQFYMGKNTQDRQNFIIDNLKVELDLLEELG
jgi:topoisomerase-4 subunit B